LLTPSVDTVGGSPTCCGARGNAALLLTQAISS